MKWIAAAALAICLAIAGCGGTSGDESRPSATATASPTAPSEAGTARQQAEQAIAAEEQARKAAVAAVAKTTHPDDDVWAAMNEPMVVPEEMAALDPNDAAWTDLAAQADETREWWVKVAADPSLPWGQNGGG